MSNIPKLRFKEFSMEWEEKTLKSISDLISYGLTVRPEYIENGIPLISARELKGGKVNYNIAPKISENSYNILSSKAKANKGDIFLTKTGTIGLSAYVDVDFPIAITQNISVIRVDNKLYHHQFILQTFKTKQFYKHIMQKVNQSTIMDLQLQDIRKSSINLPQKQEQQKIASFLTSIDTKIEQLSSKQQLLEEYKKGIMQKIFSQEIKFKDDDGGEFLDWEVKKLGEISDVRDGTHDSPKYYENGFPLITSKNLLKNGTIDFNNVNLILLNDYNNINKRSKVSIGDILFGMIGTIGNPVLLNSDGFAIKNVALIKEQEVLKNTFLLHYLNSQLIEKQFYEQNTGGTQKFIALGVIRNLIINLPQLKEQTKIANFLSSIDKKIQSVSNQLVQTKEFKKGLLQKMFV